MPVVEVKFDARQLKDRILQLGKRFKNFPLKLLGEMIVTEVDDLIQSEGELGRDGKWQPFAQSTLVRYPRRIGGKLLQDTGILANMQVKTAEKKVVRVSSPAAYAGFHVTGNRNLPKRNFLAINLDKVLDDAGDIIMQEIDRT